MKDIERMVVSAHEDGEVESPWKERVAQRVVQDPEWAAEARVHQGVKKALAASPEPDWSEASQRIRDRVLRGAPVTKRPLPLGWLSVAAAAAAALILAVGGGYWAGRQAAPGTSASDVAELQVQVPKSMGLQLSGEGQLLMASTLQRTGR